MLRVMIDIETLSLSNLAVTTQIGMLIVDADDPDTPLCKFQEYLPIQPQLDIGRLISADTMLWWLNQADEAKQVFAQSAGGDMDEVISVAQHFVRKYNQVVSESDEVEVWARGPQFDFVVLESLLGNCSLELPWKYSEVRDLRTAMSLARITSKDVPMQPGLIAHNAFDDCAYQMDCLYAALKLIGQGA